MTQEIQPPRPIQDRLIMCIFNPNTPKQEIQMVLTEIEQIMIYNTQITKQLEIATEQLDELRLAIAGKSEEPVEPPIA